MTRTEWRSRIKAIEKQIRDYERDKIALTKSQESKLHNERHLLISRCEHWKTEQGYHDTHREDEYSRDHTSHYYIVRCVDCKHIKGEDYLGGHEYGCTYGCPHFNKQPRIK